jgi:hypothetical protein
MTILQINIPIDKNLPKSYKYISCLNKMNAQFHPQDFLIWVKTTLKQLNVFIIVILMTHILATQFYLY